jgi:hypothetical protein
MTGAVSLERFERLYIPEPNSGCWLWLGSLSAGGYARITVGRSINAHRVSWQLFRGEIPADKPHVLHTCDMRCCVNPDHLFVGTNADNVADKVAKGRQARSAKLTTDIVRLIRADGRSQRVIAESYHVTQSNVSRIKSREIWPHVD